MRCELDRACAHIAFLRYDANSEPLRILLHQPADDALLEKVIGLVKERCTFLTDFATQSSFFFQPPAQTDWEAVRPKWNDQKQQFFVELIRAYQLIPAWQHDDLEKEFKEKFKTTEAPFFSREYYNAANIVMKAMDYLIEKNRPITGEALQAAIFEIKTFGSSVAQVTFDKSNTAVRGLEIYQYTKTERKVVAVEEQK